MTTIRTTALGDPAGEARVAADLALVVSAVRECVPAGRLTSIALLGGFGRGEGGMLADASGELRAFNDYDLMVTVNEPIDEAPLHALGAQLARRLDIDFVDIGVAAPVHLAAAPHEVFWYELREGHQILFGDPAPLAAIPRRDPATLPLVEATRLLVNRGLALLWARLDLEEARSGAAGLTPARRRFAVNAIWKSLLAAGDAVLIEAGRYHLSYPERVKRIAECDIPFAPGAAPTFRAVHEAATRFKLFPSIPEDPVSRLLAQWDEARHWHEQAFAWIEGRRLGVPLRRWSEYPPRLALETLREAAPRPLAYWRGRRTVPDLRHWARWVLDPERSYRARLPFLLYAAEAGGFNGSLLHEGLRPAPAADDQWASRWQAASRRLIGEWHP